MNISQQDFNILLSSDAIQNDTLTETELFMAQPYLKNIFLTGVELQSTNKKLQPTSIIFSLEKEEDAVNVNFYYDHKASGNIEIYIPLLTQFARGHLLHLTVEDQDGNLLSRHILNSSRPSVILQDNNTDSIGIFYQYLQEGIWHIWIGIDHILFLLTLLLPAVLIYKNHQWQPQIDLRLATVNIFKVVTAFTIAHSITLILAVLNIINLPPRLVESTIALSVFITAANNLRPFLPVSPWFLAFVFGLIHGFGFANVLMELNIRDSILAISLFGFNLGVELGQLVIVISVFPVIALIRHSSIYRMWLFNISSTAAALIAIIWIYERVFNTKVFEYI